MISPALCLFSAAGMMGYFRVTSRMALHHRYGTLVRVAFPIILLEAITFANFWTYFVMRPQSLTVWEEESRDGGLAALLASFRGGSEVVLVDPSLLWKVVIANSLFLTYRPKVFLISPSSPAIY